MLKEVVPNISVLLPSVPIEKHRMQLPLHTLSKTPLCMLLVSRHWLKACISYVYNKLVVKETIKKQKSSHSQGLASTKAVHCILLKGKLLSAFALACYYVKNL